MPVGTDGQVLVADSADAQGVAWKTRSAVGGWVCVDQETASGAGSITLTIPSGYTDLMIRIKCADTNTGASLYNAYLQFNGDTTTANYFSSQYIQSQNTALLSGNTVAASNGSFYSFNAGSQNNAGAMSAIAIEIPSYSDATFTKNFIAHGSHYFSTSHTGRIVNHVSGGWNNTAAITSVTFVPPNGTFTTGSIFTAYCGGP